MSSAPRISILVLNYNGERHLRECLPTLEALDYSNAEIVVVDNGSRDDSLTFVRRHHPKARIIELGANLGFAAGYNKAVAGVSSDLVALLNNDTRVDRRWLAELVATMGRHQATAVSSAIVDWDGQRIDFAGGLPTFLGHSWQAGHGEPVGGAYPERQLLFASGGSLLVSRSAFLDAGGFDEDFFAYFEDVDLGWRLSLMGGRIFYSPKALTFHRLHGTASGWPHALRLRLYERNALATIYKNYGDEALGRVLPVAIALTIARGLHHSDFDSASVQFGRPAPPVAHVPPPLVSTLIALEDFGQWLPSLRDKRRTIQARRQVSDDELFQLFPEPLRLHEISDTYRETAHALIRDFKIAERFELDPPPPIISAGRWGARDVDVTVAPGRRVSVVILTATGALHLPACLDALGEQTWPATDLDIIVVDNGSHEDPTATVRQHYPSARVIRTGANLGFSGGNNAGAREAKGDWLVFLNDDTRVAPDFIERLMEVAERRRAASVGAFIVDWDGKNVDFGGGLANMEARGYSLSLGMPIAEVVLKEEPNLFACGAGVLFRRDVFDAAGQWDEATFAYYEDVEIGWRLWLLGHEVWFAPKAVVQHKHHGTSGQSGSPARRRALERNALRILYTHLEQHTLQRLLPAALLLAIDRALLGTPFSRAQDAGAEHPFARLRQRLRPRLVLIRYLHALNQRGARRARGTIANLKTVGVSGLVGSAAQVASEVAHGWESIRGRDEYFLERVRPDATLTSRFEEISIDSMAALLGVQDFLASIPSLSEKRAWLQGARTISDRQIVQQFGKYWLHAVPSAQQDLHNDLQQRLIEVFALAKVEDY